MNQCRNTQARLVSLTDDEPLLEERKTQPAVESSAAAGSFSGDALSGQHRDGKRQRIDDPLLGNLFTLPSHVCGVLLALGMCCEWCCQLIAFLCVCMCCLCVMIFYLTGSTGTDTCRCVLPAEMQCELALSYIPYSIPACCSGPPIAQPRFVSGRLSVCVCVFV